MKIDLHWIDLSLVIAYLVVIAVVGLWYSRGVKTSKDLFLGGRSLPWWAVGLSLVVTDIGAKDMLGLADEGYRYGMVVANFDFLGCVLPVLVAAFVFMPFLWMAGVYTIPEYLGRRYNMVVRVMFAVALGLIMVGMLSVIFVTSAKMFESLLGWDFTFSVIATALLVGIYTTFGGLKAVVITDFVSCIVLIVGASLICFYGLQEIGGWSAMQEKIASLPNTERHFDLVLPADSKKYSWPEIVLGLGFVMGPAYWIGNQAIVQRSFGTRSQKDARAAYVLCAGVKLIFPFLLVVPGLIGLALFHDTLGPVDAEKFEGGRVLPAVLQLLPRGVMGIVLGAFLAGVMSNLDSYLNSAATLWVTDLYQVFIKPDAKETDLLVVGRVLVVLFLIGGIIGSYAVAEHFDTVFDAFQTFMSFFQGSLMAVLLLGVLTKRATQWGATVGMVVGIGTSITLYIVNARSLFDVSYLWAAWWSFVAAMVSTIVVSLLTKPYDEQRLRGLVYWLPAAENSFSEDDVSQEKS